MFFGKKESKLQGMKVSINEGSKTPQQRYERARSRVDNLQNKLRRLTDGRHKSCNALDHTIAQTKFAIEEWEKRMLVAEFEMKINRGDV